mmetsp:Transcript_11567/g.21881  ORF Transcript_11567/g.21881 Transcript_11567/m.21881 type:complete len:943 (+) Transcript_11567:413-3241(+)
MIFSMKSLLVAMSLASSTDGRQLRSLASSSTEEAVAEAAVIESGFSVYEPPTTDEDHHANIFASSGAEEDDAAAEDVVQTSTETGATKPAAAATTASYAAKSGKANSKSRKVEPPPMVNFCPEPDAMAMHQAGAFSPHKRPAQTAWKDRKNPHKKKSESPGEHSPNKPKRNNGKRGNNNEESSKKHMQKPRFLKGVGGGGSGKNKRVNDVLPPSPPSSPIEEEKDTDVKPQIVGGHDVDPPRNYPFFAWYGGCAGSLIAPNLILSAAHCEEVAVDGIITMGTHILDVDAMEAEDEFSNIEQIRIKNVIVHPCYDDVSDDNDFMIIELEHPTIMYLENIVELDTPDDNGVDLVDGLSLTVVGFGALFQSEALFVAPDTLQEVDVGVDNTCGEYLPSEITDNMLCAGSEGLDACQGDSGGPIIDTATQKLVGVTSFGIGCGRDGFPGVYSRVSAAFDWIEYVMAEKASEDAAPATAAAEDTISGWFDSFGDGCLWYADNVVECPFSATFANGGLDANEVCGVCAAVEHVAEIDGSAEEGTATFEVDFLYDGEYEAAVHGFVAAQIISDTVTVGAGFMVHRLEISDMAAFRVALPFGVTSAFFIDLDLYVIDPNGIEVASSENFDTDEFINIINPMDGTWTVEVVAFNIDSSGNRFEGDYDLYVWKIPTTPSDDDGFIINSAPDTATRGGSGEVNFSYPTDLSEDEWFLGAVSHTGKGTLQSVTLLTFDSNVEFEILIDTTDFLFYQGSDGKETFNATFGYTGDYVAEALPLVAATLDTGFLDLSSDFVAFEFDLIDQAYFQALLPSRLHDSALDDLDMLLIDPNGQIVGESTNDFIDDEYVELVFPENGIYSVYIYGAFFDNPEVEYSMLTWKLPMGSSGTNLVVEDSPDSAIEGETVDIDVSFNGLTTGNGPDHYFIGAVSHTGTDDANDVKVLTTVEINNGF